MRQGMVHLWRVSFVRDLSVSLSAERLWPRHRKADQSGGRPGRIPPNHPLPVASLRSSGPASLRALSKAPSNRCDVIKGVIPLSPSQTSFSPARTPCLDATQQHLMQTTSPAPWTRACVRYPVLSRLTMGGTPGWSSCSLWTGGSPPGSPGVSCSETLQ